MKTERREQTTSAKKQVEFDVCREDRFHVELERTGPGPPSPSAAPVIELNQLLVSAKAVQLKRAGETNLLQIEPVDVLRSWEKSETEGGDDGRAVGGIHLGKVPPPPRLEPEPW